MRFWLNKRGGAGGEHDMGAQIMPAHLRRLPYLPPHISFHIQVTPAASALQLAHHHHPR